MSHLFVLKFIFSFILYDWLYFVHTHITHFLFHLFPYYLSSYNKHIERQNTETVRVNKRKKENTKRSGMNELKHLKNKTKTLEKIIVYLGTEISPRSDFSGLQRTVMTELRP